MLASGPCGAGHQEPSADAETLEIIGDRDRDFGGLGTVGLQTHVADDPFVWVGTGYRDEAFTVVMIGRAKRAGLCVAYSWPEGKEARSAAFGRKARVEALERGLVGRADRTNVNGARSTRV